MRYEWRVCVGRVWLVFGCVEVVEVRLDLVYGVGCKGDAHKGRDSLDRVWLV